MRKIMGVRNAFQLIQRYFRGFQGRPFCDSTSSAEKGRRVTRTSSNGGDIRDLDVYRDLDKLDFMKAAKILFTHLLRRRNLADYLVAQYARYEMRRMDAELEIKKKEAEEEAKKKKEEAAAKENEEQSSSELLEVNERLHALEKTLNEIAAETTKQPKPTKDQSSAVSDPKQISGSITDDKEKSQNTGSSNVEK